MTGQLHDKVAMVAGGGTAAISVAADVSDVATASACVAASRLGLSAHTLSASSVIQERLVD